MQDKTVIPSVTEIIANRCTTLCTELRRVDDMIELIRWAINACQKPGNGKINILREKPKEPLMWLYGTPRIGEMYWARSGKFLTKKLPAKHITKRAKSKGAFTDSYEIMVENLKMLDDLMNMRSALVAKFMSIHKLLADVDEYTPTLDEMVLDVQVLYSDSREIRDSDHKTTAQALGYSGKKAKVVIKQVPAG